MVHQQISAGKTDRKQQRRHNNPKPKRARLHLLQHIFQMLVAVDNLSAAYQFFLIAAVNMLQRFRRLHRISRKNIGTLFKDTDQLDKFLRWIQHK